MSQQYHPPITKLDAFVSRADTWKFMQGKKRYFLSLIQKKLATSLRIYSSQTMLGWYRHAPPRQPASSAFGEEGPQNHFTDSGGS
jgi:hypothetical protein